MLIAKGRLEENIHQSRNCSTYYARDMKFKVNFYDLTKVVDLMHIYVLAQIGISLASLVSMQLLPYN